MKEINMLGDKEAVANIAVKNLEIAKKFYEETLGLTQIGAEDQQEVIVFRSGSSTIYVYKSQYAGTNQATALTWVVGKDIEGVVQELKAKGVTFERYDDMPDVTRQDDDDIHVAGDRK